MILVSFGISPHLMGQGSANYSTPGSSTWTPPPGVASFTLKLWGAGGGGGNANGSLGQGGGGGGAFEIVNVTNASYIGLPINLNVGAGGTAGNAGGNTVWGNVVSASGGGGSNTGNGFGGIGGIGVAQSFSDATFLLHGVVAMEEHPLIHKKQPMVVVVVAELTMETMEVMVPMAVLLAQAQLG